MLKANLSRLSLCFTCILLASAGVTASASQGADDTDPRYAPQQKSPWSEAELDDLRRLYVDSPDLFAEYISRQLHGSTEAFRLGRRLSTTEALREVEQALAGSGESFLENNPLVERQLDSLRLAYFDHPRSFTSGRLEHVSTVSRKASRTPFLRGNPMLEERLLVAAEEYFANPEAFSDRRLEELNGISMNVLALPFLRGNPILTSMLERARLKFDNDRQTYTEERLAELDLISTHVANEPFRPGSSATLAFVLVGAGLIIASLVLIRLRTEDTYGVNENGAPVTAVDQEMSFSSALSVLRLDPDYTEEQLTSAYRTLQKQYHPDRVTHLGEEFRLIAESKTRRINDAYHLLLGRGGRGPKQRRSRRQNTDAA